MANKKKDIVDFRTALKNKKIPILTLDNRWHELFPKYDKPDHIKELEENLNHLIKRQGKLTTDSKDMKTLKKQLMAEIIQNMDTETLETRSKNEKKLDRNQFLIQDINSKLKSYEEELGDMPYRIKEVNEELMVQSMAICYDRLHRNRDSINVLNSLIDNMREEIRNRLLLKQDLETANSTLYSYMHNLLGAPVMEVFDRKEKENE